MSLPLSKAQVTKGAAWLMANFADKIAATIAGKPYGASIVCAIACKEIGNVWIHHSNSMTAAALLPLLVGDASGDWPDTSRSAFPQNTAAFRAEFGDVFTAMLIGEANAARHLRGLGPKEIVYKGYGIFQYDLQHVKPDREFFEQRLWHTIDPCLDRLDRELMRCFKASHGDTRGAVRRYNGAGRAAEEYADHVMTFAAWCEGRS